MKPIVNIGRVIWPRTKEDAGILFGRIFWVIYLALGYKLIRIIMVGIRPKIAIELAVVTVLVVLVHNMKSRVMALALLAIVTAAQLYRMAWIARAVIKGPSPGILMKSAVPILGGFFLIALLVVITRAVFVLRGKSSR